MPQDLTGHSIKCWVIRIQAKYSILPDPKTFLYTILGFPLRSLLHMSKDWPVNVNQYVKFRNVLHCSFRIVRSYCKSEDIAENPAETQCCKTLSSATLSVPNPGKSKLSYSFISYTETIFLVYPSLPSTIGPIGKLAADGNIYM